MVELFPEMGAWKKLLVWKLLSWRSLLLLLLLVASVVSDSVRPHRRQPTRLPRPWDSPGKNTSGLPFPSPMHESEKWKWSRSVVSDSRPHGLQPTRLLCPQDFPGKSTGVGCHCLLRGYLLQLGYISSLSCPNLYKTWLLDTIHFLWLLPFQLFITSK